MLRKAQVDTFTSVEQLTAGTSMNTTFKLNTAHNLYCD